MPIVFMLISSQFQEVLRCLKMKSKAGSGSYHFLIFRLNGQKLLDASQRNHLDQNIPVTGSHSYTGLGHGLILIVEGINQLSFFWEHIINDAKIITRGNIALCCCSCNASKGQKKLSDWLQSKYCKDHGINSNTVSPIIKHAIVNNQ